MQTIPLSVSVSHIIHEIIESTVEKYNINNSAHEIAKLCTEKIKNLKGLPENLTKEQIYAKIYFEVRVVAERLKPAFFKSFSIASDATASILLHPNR